MSSVPLHYVDVRTFCYATEDDDRVEDALRSFLPEEFEIERASSEGHYGDPIVVLSARVEKADGIRSVLSALDGLSDSDRDELIGQLDERVDENCSFFVTFDKQAAVDGGIALGDGITMRAKVEAYPAKQEAAVENAQEILKEL